MWRLQNRVQQHQCTCISIHVADTVSVLLINNLNQIIGPGCSKNLLSSFISNFSASMRRTLFSVSYPLWHWYSEFYNNNNVIAFWPHLKISHPVIALICFVYVPACSSAHFKSHRWSFPDYPPALHLYSVMSLTRSSTHLFAVSIKSCRIMSLKKIFCFQH